MNGQPRLSLFPEGEKMGIFHKMRAFRRFFGLSLFPFYKP